MKNIGINLEVVNQFNSWINDPKNPYIRQIRSILNKYGTVEEINAKARNAKLLSTRMSRLEAIGATEYIEQISGWRDSVILVRLFPLRSSARAFSVTTMQALISLRPMLLRWR